MPGPNGQPLVPAVRKGKKPENAPEDEAPSFFLGLGFGSGVGWASGKGEVNAMDVVDPAGFAMSKLVHFTPEFGYYLSPEFMLSVQFRLQLISGGNAYYSIEHDGVRRRRLLAGHLRVRRLRPRELLLRRRRLSHLCRGHGGAGHDPPLATFESQKNCGKDAHTRSASTPSRRGRYSSAGARGIMYNLSPAFAVTFGTNALVGFTRFTFHVDLNAGVAFEF